MGLAAPVSYAGGFSKAGGEGSNYNKDPDKRPGCDQKGTVFTGGYGADPCRWTKNNKNPTDSKGVHFAIDYKGGNQVINHMVDWWNKQFLPDLKNMTAELHAMIINQTRNIGSLVDAQNVNAATRALQQRELEAKKQLQPNEKTCVAGSLTTALTQSESIGRSLSNGFNRDIMARSGNAKGLPSASGPFGDQKARWDIFCKTFHDPDNNAGQSACPNPLKPGILPNGDIDIEGVLFQDTIDLSKPEQLAAAQAILINLVQPAVKEPIDPETAKSPQGQAYLLHQEHIEAVRSVASDVVSSIISRRASIPNVDSGVSIAALRTRAGIDPARISTNPSYNEIMRTLTKERFFDPDYYARLSENLGALRQEQSAIRAYISMQMDDIYQLQEQINTLIAVKNSMKINQTPAPERWEVTPVDTSKK